jgi:putative ABC transport system permease protein
MSAGWGLSLRLAWREARRRPGRTALLVLLIGLPVAALATGLIVVRTASPTPAESRARTMGQADQVFAPTLGPLTGDADGAADALAAASPDGSHVVAIINATDAATRRDGHLQRISVSDQPLDDPLFDGRLTLGSGRVPEGPREVAVGEELSRRLDVSVGDEIELLALGRVTITGTVRETSANDFRVGAVVGAPLTPPPEQFANGVAWITVFVQHPPGTDVPVAIPAEFVELHYGVEDARTQMGIAYAVGAVGLLLMGTVAAAAFAVSARRHLRLLGVLAANGVPPSGLRRIMVLQGAVTGAVASSVGIGVALVAGQIIIEPRLDRLVSRAVTPLDIPVPYLVLAWAMGVVAAAAAAWVPAHTAARVPVLSALAGRRPQPRTRVLGPIVGLVVAASGVAVLGVFVAWSHAPWGLGLVGAGLVLTGGTLCMPWLASRFEPAGGRLRGPARMGARGLARNRVRTCAVATAIMAPAVAATFGATIDASAVETSSRRDVRDDQVVVQAIVSNESEWASRTSLVPGEDVLDEVRTVLPGATEAPLRLLADPAAVSGPQSAWVTWAADADADSDPDWGGVGWTTVAVASEDLLEALAAPSGTIDLLDDDNTVVALSAVPDDLEVRLDSPAGGAGPVLFDRASVVVADPDAVGENGLDLPAFVVSQSWADSRGFTTVDTGVVFRSPEPLTSDQRAELRPDGLDADDAQIRTEVLGTPPESSEGWYAAFATPAQREWEIGAAIAAGVLAFTLLVVAVTLALNAAESRDERALLRAIGAPPRVERVSRAWEATLLPAMAMVVAVPLGLASALTVIAVGGGGAYRATVPWLVVATLLVAVPVVSGGVTRLVTAVAGRLGRSVDLVGALAGD